MGFVRRGTGIVGSGNGGSGGIDGLYEPSTINSIALRVRGLAGQISQLFGVYDSSDVLLAGFESDGDIFAPDAILNFGEVDEFRVTDFYTDYQDNGVKYDVNRDFPVFPGTAKEFFVGNELLEAMSTGVEEFSGFTITNGGADLTVGAGSGHIVDLAGDTYSELSWTAFVGETIAADNDVTYIFINSAGALVKQTAEPTASDFRNLVYLGRVIKIGGTIIQALAEPHVYLQGVNQLYDLFKALGLFNSYGNEITPNGANLNIDKAVGGLFSAGANFINNPEDPHEVTIAASSPTTFAYVTRVAGSTGADTTTIDPANYDNAGVITSIGGSGQRATIQRVYLFPSGAVRIHYGQTIYSNIAEALSQADSETFTVNPNIPNNGILIGLIVLRRDATDLSNINQARFLQASKFGSNTAGQSVSSLQNAYDNSVDATILTDSTRGGLKLRDFNPSTGTAIIEVTNLAGGSVFFSVNNTGITAGGGNPIFNASQLQTRNVASTAPIDGQVLSWVAANTRWEPVTIASRYVFVANQNIAAAGQITPNVQAAQMVLRVTGDGGAVTTSTTPLDTALPGGTLVILYGQDDVNTVTIPRSDTAGGFLINGQCVLRSGSMLAVVYDSAADRFIELYRSE